MSNAIVRILREKEGTEMVEWGLIAGLIIVLAIRPYASPSDTGKAHLWR